LAQQLKLWFESGFVNIDSVKSTLLQMESANITGGQLRLL